MNKLKELLEKEINKLYPGATFSIITKDKISIDYVGDTSIDMLYDLASLTKVIVTNILISLAIEEKKISLEDKLSDYLLEYKYLDPINNLFSPITIKELLTHQSALKIDNIKDRLIKLYKKDYDIAASECQKNIKNIKIDMNQIIIKNKVVNKKVQYANINYILLKELLESIYNQEFDILAQEKIFNPLNMKDTHFNKIGNYIDKSKYAPTENTNYRGLVCGEVHDENAYFLGGISGNAGLFSNIKDVSKFVKMIINDGDNYLDKDTINSWFEKCSDKRTIGWEYYDKNIIKHTGFTGNLIFINRNKNIGIIILSNRIYYGRENNKIYDLFDKICKLYS